MSDDELVQKFRTGGDEGAFAELVSRHAAWVYSAALRQVRDAHLADDVTQTVFIILARKAGSLSRSKPLGPWLFHVTRFACREAMRAADRRKRHERMAATMTAPVQAPADDPQWAELTPLLDKLVARLSAPDRQAVLLRFYERQTMAQIAAAMQLSPAAARKRVERAIERLRDQFQRHGVTTTTAAMDAALLAHTARTANPAAVKLAQSAVHIQPTPLVHATLAAMAKTKLFVTAVAAGVLVVAAGVVILAIGANKSAANNGKSAAAKPPTSQQLARQPLPGPRIADGHIPRGWPLALPGSITGTPSLADLDGDGKLEILVPCMARPDDPPYVHSHPDNAALLYALHADGSLVSGFPAELMNQRERQSREQTGYYNESWSSSPSVCRANGKTQIVLTTPFFLGIRVIDADGTVHRHRGGSQWANVPLADLNHTGVPDIITGAGLMTLGGKPISYWPRAHPMATQSGFAPCIGDADGDGQLEVFHLFANTPDPAVFFADAPGNDLTDVGGFDHAGKLLAGWPKKINNPYWRAPVMGDVSGDGKMEVIGVYGNLFVWTLDGKSAPGTHDDGELSGILKSDVAAAMAPATLADMDGDGKAEIIVYDRHLHAIRAWHGDGRPMGADADGVIATLTEPAPTIPGDDSIPWAGVAAANLGDDGLTDLFCGTYWVRFDPKTKKSVINRMLPEPAEMNWNQPTIADVDGDGKADVIMGLRDGRLIVYNTHLTCSADRMQWPTVNGNFQHTGAWKPPPMRSAQALSPQARARP